MVTYYTQKTEKKVSSFKMYLPAHSETTTTTSAVSTTLLTPETGLPVLSSNINIGTHPASPRAQPPVHPLNSQQWE